MISLGLVFFYYWIILFSIIGYGYLFSKFFLLKSSENNYVGYVGFYGIFSLLLISCPLSTNPGFCRKRCKSTSNTSCDDRFSGSTKGRFSITSIIEMEAE